MRYIIEGISIVDQDDNKYLVSIVDEGGENHTYLIYNDLKDQFIYADAQPIPPPSPGYSVTPTNTTVSTGVGILAKPNPNGMEFGGAKVSYMDFGDVLKTAKDVVAWVKSHGENKTTSTNVNVKAKTDKKSTTPTVTKVSNKDFEKVLNATKNSDAWVKSHGGVIS